MKTIIEKLHERDGIVITEEQNDNTFFTQAPATLAEIPATLIRFFASGGFSSSNQRQNWLLSTHFIQSDYFSVVPKTSVGCIVDAYSFPLIPNSYVVTNQSHSLAIIIVMRQESGRWKIDNIIPRRKYDAFLEMDVINWDCTPLIY